MDIGSSNLCPRCGECYITCLSVSLSHHLVWHHYVCTIIYRLQIRTMYFLQWCIYQLAIAWHLLLFTGKPTCYPHTQFTCPSGACVPLRAMCDGRNDCGDDVSNTKLSSDEVGCGKIIIYNICQYIMFVFNRYYWCFFIISFILCMYIACFIHHILFMNCTQFNSTVANKRLLFLFL